jgi:hypothetical protein
MPALPGSCVTSTTMKSPKETFMQLTIDEQIEKHRAISWQQGFEEGFEEGFQEAAGEVIRPTIIKILQRRFPNNDFILDIYEQQLLRICTKDELLKLVAAAFEINALPDFLMRLQSVFYKLDEHPKTTSAPDESVPDLERAGKA